MAQNTIPVLRTRDILAAIVLVWLFAVAWDDSVTDDPSASIRLSFFIPQTRDDRSTVTPKIFDVDGDGSPEAMVAWLSSAKRQTDGPIEATSWTLEVHDLRPSLLAKQHGKPFQPKVLLQAATMPVSIESPIPHRPPIDLYPLSMTTGQVMLEKQAEHDSSNPKRSKTPPADRTLQYFCGKDWHDASERCGTHCPSGQSNDCPDNERCFADTACDASKTTTTAQSMLSYHTTPAGGIPSVFTAWSGANVTMHSITGEGSSASLQLKHMWTVSPFLPDDITTRKVEVEWDSVATTFVDAIEASNDAGMVLVKGTATAVWKHNDNKDGINGDDELDQNSAHGTFVVALDTRTGATIWKSVDDDQLEKALFHPELEEAVPLPIVERGVTSTARRRSHLARTLSHTMDTSSPNCMQEYRHSILTSNALPFQVWGEDNDMTIRAMHFDHHGNDGKSAHANKNYSANQKRATGSNSRKIDQRGDAHHNSRKKHWLPSALSRHHHRHWRTTPKRGKPNVVVTHSFDGIQVRALKNGRSLCHISLQPQTLYADINHDGKLDSVQLITGEEVTLAANDDDEEKRDGQWIQDMVQRVADANHQVPDKSMSAHEQLMMSREASNRVCRILAFSGVPAMEELFNADACGGRLHNLQMTALQQNSSATSTSVRGAPLLLMESIAGRRKQLGYDVVSATSIGVVTRYRGTSGRILWRRIFSDSANGTLWDDDAFLMPLGRLDALTLTPPARPIVLSDRTSISILSAQTGILLATAPLGEHPEVTPLIIDLNGDGTSDVLIVTRSAIWGYTVTVGAGGSVAFRIIVGLLAMGLMLALLRNRFGQRPGKRGTDL